MSTAPKPAPIAHDRPVLESGDRMSRAGFHRIYEQMPDKFKAELIGRIMATLHEGLAAPEHAASVTRLAGARAKHAP
jgi:hypothetical protein